MAVPLVLRLRLEAGEAQLRMVTDNLPNGMLYQLRREPGGATRFAYVNSTWKGLIATTA